MNWLQNSWMDNPIFLAEMAHFAWAYSIVITAALFSANRRQLIQLVFAFTVFALLKEFWYDLTYELPNDSFDGSLLDFAVYCLGLSAALAVVWYRRRLQDAKTRRAVMALTYLSPRPPFPAGFSPRIYDPER